MVIGTRSCGTIRKKLQITSQHVRSNTIERSRGRPESGNWIHNTIFPGEEAGKVRPVLFLTGLLLATGHGCSEVFGNKRQKCQSAKIVKIMNQSKDQTSVAFGTKATFFNGMSL
jgi:hypothetical protein